MCALINQYLSYTPIKFVTFFSWPDSRSGPTPPHSWGLEITLRHITLRSTLDEWSARRRHPYLTTHNTQQEKDIHVPCGFEPALPASERLQTHTLDGAATGICPLTFIGTKNPGKQCWNETTIVLNVLYRYLNPNAYLRIQATEFGVFLVCCYWIFN
jgi:hypothetical protein